MSLDEMLTAYDGKIRGLGKVNHHHPADHFDVIQRFIDLYFEGVTYHHQDVVDWARNHKWSEDDAKDLADLGDNVAITMKLLDNKGQLRR